MCIRDRGGSVHIGAVHQACPACNGGNRGRVIPRDDLQAQSLVAEEIQDFTSVRSDGIQKNQSAKGSDLLGQLPPDLLLACLLYTSNLAAAIRLLNELSLAVQTRVDIGINYEGWNDEKTGVFLSEFFQVRCV